VAGHEADGLEARLIQDGHDVVSVGCADIIGIARGRDVLVSRFASTVGDGSPSAARKAVW
jgi:hypothetical protein